MNGLGPAVVTLVALAPTLVFLAALALVGSMSDESVGERIRRGRSASSTAPPGVGPDGDPGEADVVCERCGTSNTDVSTFCRECLGSLGT